MPLELTGPQFKPLSEALRRRFELKEFKRMLKQHLDKELEDISVSDTYEHIVFDVIGKANREGWVYRLVDAARQERPDEPVFVEYARLLGFGPRKLPSEAELEKIIKKSNAQLDIATFRSRLGEIEGRVCRVDLQGDGIGTGFLVGPDIVMTNYHVIESILKQEHSEQEFSCRFDFKVREDGTSVNKGTIRAVVELLTYSPYDLVDLQDGAQLPDATNLDYALLRLDSKLGGDPIGDITPLPGSVVQPRGWIRLKKIDHAFEPNSPLFIVQHPNKWPMKLALDTEAVIRLNENKTRVRYNTNTDPGSSGSPCFNQNWELVALHHSGDPEWVPTWNEGIPINLIYDHILATDFGQYIQQELSS